MHLGGLVIRICPFQGYRLLATYLRHRLACSAHHTCYPVVAQQMLSPHHRFGIIVRTPFRPGQRETSRMSCVLLTNDSWRSRQMQPLAIVVVIQCDKTLMNSKLHVAWIQKKDPGDGTSTHTR